MSDMRFGSKKETQKKNITVRMSYTLITKKNYAFFRLEHYEEYRISNPKGS